MIEVWVFGARLHAYLIKTTPMMCLGPCWRQTDQTGRPPTRAFTVAKMRSRRQIRAYLCHHAGHRRRPAKHRQSSRKTRRRRRRRLEGYLRGSPRCQIRAYLSHNAGHRRRPAKYRQSSRKIGRRRRLAGDLRGSRKIQNQQHQNPRKLRPRRSEDCSAFAGYPKRASS